MLDFMQLETFIDEQMKAANVPGLAFAIVQGTEVICAKGMGVTSMGEGGTAVTPSTLFRIGSVAKIVTAVLIMRLVEQGKIDLDRPIRDYVDWFTLSEESAGEQVTMRMLLSHASGIASGFERFGSRDPEGLKQFVRDRVPRLPMYFPPGKTCLYSNYGHSVAGYLAEAVTGTFFADLMQERVFDSLGMNSTTFDSAKAMTYPLALSHHEQEKGTLSVFHQHTLVTHHHPEGGGYSNVLDLAQLALMLVNQGRLGDDELLSSDSITEMYRLHGDYFTHDGAGYGLSFELERYKGLLKVWKDGMIDHYGAWFVMVPERKFAIVLMCNKARGFFGHADEIIHYILDQAFDLKEHQVEPIPVEPNRLLWSDYAGTYAGPWTGGAQVDIEEDQLILTLNGERVMLQAKAENRYFGYKSDGELLFAGFLSEAEGPVQFVMIDSIPCERIAADRLKLPESHELHKFEGVFWKKDGSVQIRLAESQLQLRLDDNEVEEECRLVSVTQMFCDGDLYDFLLDAEGKVIGLCQNRTHVYEKVC